MCWRCVGWFSLLTVAFLVGGPAIAQNAADPRKWANEFIEQVVAHGAPAFEATIRRTILGESMSQSIDDLTKQLEEGTRQFGPAVSSEYISERKLGSRLRELNYIVYHTKMFLIWRMAFYKSNSGWQMFGITFTSHASQIPWEQ